MQLSMDIKHNSVAYNLLTTVEESDERVRDQDLLNHFLTSAAPIFVNNNQHHRFGVALLHKHCVINSNEIMLETNESYQGENALITRPVVEMQSGKETYPGSWQFSNNCFVPSEYTTDQKVQHLLDSAPIPPKFLNQFAALIKQFDVQDFLGLAVVERTLYQSALKDEIPLEFTDEERRENIVVIRNKKVDQGRLIETSWGFRPEASSTSECTSTCKRRCWSIDGGHRKEHQPHHIVVR